MKFKKNVLLLFRVFECSPETDYRSQYGYDKNRSRNDQVCIVNLPVASLCFNKPTYSDRDDNGNNRVKKSFHPIVIIPVPVIGDSQCEVVAVGPVTSKRHSHGNACQSYTGKIRSEEHTSELQSP